MVTSRYITQEDYTMLAGSLAADPYHSDTLPDFFYEPGTVCSVFEDEQGPILFVKGTPLGREGTYIIKLDIQYVDNIDIKRNMKAMTEGFPIIESRARENDFIGFMFNSEVALLRKFCIKRLGFQELNDQFLGKIFQQEALDKETEGAV